MPAAPRPVLLVCYDFPPAGGSGVQRMLKLARYLPDAGWQPTVLTCGHAHHALHDPQLLDELPAGVRVIRVNGWEPAGLVRSFTRAVLPAGPVRDGVEQRLTWRAERAASLAPARRLLAAFNQPESPALWSAAASRAAVRLVQEAPFDAVATSGPPHSVHRVGLALKRRFGLAWIADLRDPITTNFAYAPPSDDADACWKRLERDIVGAADRIVVTCDDFAEDLRARHASVGRIRGQTDPTSARIITIPNGYDPEDMAQGATTLTPRPDLPAAAPPTASRPAGSSPCFTLTYVGAFYKQQSIAPVLDACRLLLAARPELQGRFRLEHVGSLAAHQASLIEPADATYLARIGYLTHHAAIARMQAADALLLIVPPNAGGRLCIPAKTFEYLATGRPIVAVVHAGTALERLLRAAGNATIITDFSAGALARAIERRIYSSHGAASSDPRRTELLQRFTRQSIAIQYAETLTAVASKSAAAAISP